jgi:hypothetical protein
MYYEVKRILQQIILFRYSVGGIKESNKNIRTHVLQPRFEWNVYRKVITSEFSVVAQIQMDYVPKRCYC